MIATLTSSDGNFEPLRLVAFDCLLICKPPGRSMPLAAFLVDAIRNDTSLVVRRHIARGLSEAILFSLAMGDISTGTSVPGIVEVTQETAQSQDQKSEAQSAAIVKSLRREFSKRLDLRQALQDALM